MRSMWMPVYSGVACVCVGMSLWPQAAPAPSTESASMRLADLEDAVRALQNPVAALLQRFPLLSGFRESDADAAQGDRTGQDTATAKALRDLRVSNLSVHRIRYERAAPTEITKEEAVGTAQETQADHIDDEEDEDTLVRSLFGGGTWTHIGGGDGGQQRIASVVVTWEDHRLAAEARPASERMCGSADDPESAGICQGEAYPSDDHGAQASASSGRDVTYEMQLWVNGWGLDALWHPANRKLVTRDPFVVLHGLPQEHELSFRVRLRVTTRRGLFSGLFATEVDGPWSAIATLSPSKEHALEAIRAFLAANRAFGAVLALCIGLGVLVIMRLVLLGGREPTLATSGAGVPLALERPVSSSTSLFPSATLTRRQRLQLQQQHRQRDSDGLSVPPPPAPRCESTDTEPEVGGSSNNGTTADNAIPLEAADLAQEIRDLRQELADSEAEVRQLMLFRGFGIDALSPEELEALERELRRSLRVVHKRRRLQLRAFESLDETEEEEDEGELTLAASDDAL